MATDSVFRVPLLAALAIDTLAAPPWALERELVVRDAKDGRPDIVDEDSTDDGGEGMDEGSV